MSKDKDTVLDFLRIQSMATISTVAKNSDQPESALVAFTQTQDLEIVFESFVETRKWNNIQSNPRVAMVIGRGLDEHITVQYEGVASLISDQEKEKYIQLFLDKDTPCTEQFLCDPRARLYKVSPTWIRYSDYTKDEPWIIELDCRAV